MQGINNTPLQKPARCICKCCGWDWTPRYYETPKRCPNCNSERWNIGPASEDERIKKFKEAVANKKKIINERVVSLEEGK